MFEDKSAIVIGASAQGGSGWTIAEHLVKAGARVAVAARSMDGLNALAAKSGVSPFRCDAAIEEDVRNLVDSVKAEFGKIDVLIQAAGVPVAGTILDATDDDVRTATANNYFSFLYLLKHGVPKIEDGGSILVLTSFSASRVAPGYSMQRPRRPLKTS